MQAPILVTCYITSTYCLSFYKDGRDDGVGRQAFLVVLPE